MTAIDKDSRTQLELNVRTLAEHVYKSGDLSTFSFSGISGAEGTRLHSRVFADLRKQYLPAAIETEYSLTSTYVVDDVILLLRGRADCVLTADDGAITVLEIKSCTGEHMSMEILYQEVHWAQVMLYTYMYLEQNPECRGVYAGLRYVSIETMESTEKREWIDGFDAAKFFQMTCESYIGFARDILAYRAKRDSSIIEMPFPYETVRSGQKDLMQQVVQTISQKGLLLAAAPTGIGKTVSTLYPALKSMARDRCGRIFYLTAKAAARGVARKALSDMREKGMHLRSITLQSKESLCPCPHIYCEAKQCPYALGYYDRLPQAIGDLLLEMDIHPGLIQDIAEKHTLCPHELSLDISLFCDVIVGDYNHAFHPRIRLDRYFGQKETGFVLLVDEAHNMVDRSRDMFTAALRKTELEACQKSLMGMDSRVDGYMMDLRSYFQILTDSILRGEDGFSLVEKEVEKKDVMSAETFRGMRATPKTLYTVLWKFCHFVRPVLDALPVGELRKRVLKFFFDARFFLTILELYFDTAYVVTANVTPGNPAKGMETELLFSLTCLDASSKIVSNLIDQHSAVFFSATLSPMEYYQMMLLGDSSEARAETLLLPSPFPPENLSLYVVNDIKTTYKERNYSLAKTSGFILRALKKRPGNYLVYLPSFRYMKSLQRQIEADLDCQDTEKEARIELLSQTENMSREKKDAFLRRFDDYGQRTLLAFAVLGGHFGEGIDLVGERLNGVFVVGVGLPQLGPEREIMRQYFQERLGDGFAFAYRFPGWEKVLQAAGRVIRDENDTGIVALIDERYDRPEYRSLFPENWNPVFIGCEDEVDE